MQNVKGIRIRQALDYINSGYGEFSLTFISVDGTRKVFKPRVRLGAPPSRKKAAKIFGQVLPNEPDKKDWNHAINQSHNLLLFDIQKNRPFELKICLLTSINNTKIIWHVPR
jgi:hypothetical protein